MATSGNFLTSDSGQGSANFYGRMIFEWWQTSSGLSGSVGYHNISYHLKTYGGSSGYYQYFSNGSMNVDGSGYSWGATQAYGNGATVFGDYSKTLYTNSVGDRSFSASAQGSIFVNNVINTSGSGSWSLDHINLWGGVSSITIASPFTDESANPVVDWYHYAGIGHLWFRLDSINSGDTTYHITSPADPYTWSGWQTWLRTSMANTNTSVLDIYYGDDIDSNGSVDNWQGPWAYNVSIANGTGQANPVFTNFTYLDSNSTTTAVTGNNQVLIQGKSTLQTTVSTANKAVAQKNATMVSYVAAIGAETDTAAWSSGSNVVQNVGVISDVTGTQNLTVKAVDSRSNSTVVTKSVTVLPYESPAFEKQLDVTYTNSFDYQSGLTVAANGTKIATIAPMTLSGTDKNTFNTTSGIQFDMSKTNNTSYTGTWTNVATSRTANSTDITTVLATLGTSLLTKMAAMGVDNGVKWYIKFKITDALETQTYEISLDVGKATFRIGTDDKLYNKEQQVLVLPMLSVLADNKTAGINSGTGTITPFVITPLYIRYGTGTGNSSAVVFDVSFSFYVSSAGLRTWALKVDGTAVGNAARKFFINAINTHIPIHETVVATGLAVGSHTVTLEIYGGGSNVQTDTADVCTIVATEYANANTPLSSGPNYATTVVDGGGGGNVWSNPSNAQGTINGTVATVTEGVTAGAANQLKSSGHGFTIPGNATITGIMLESQLYGTTFDSLIDIGTSTKRSTSTPISSGLGGWGAGGVLHLVSWGGPSDLWGRTDWVPADINNTTFGAGLRPGATVASTSDQVDAIRITVYYS